MAKLPIGFSIMGDARQEVSNQPAESSTGIERASSLFLEQLVTGNFNFRRNAGPLLNEAAQLNTMSFTNDDSTRELAVRTNLYSLSTRMEWQGPGVHALFNFAPSTGWNNPFRRPTYDLEAQSADRSTMLSISSRDGAAPSIQFGHNRDGLGLSYQRNPTVNEFNFSAERGTTTPVRFDVGHDFRRQQTRLGISTVRPFFEFGLGATVGSRNYYDLGFQLRIGARPGD